MKSDSRPKTTSVWTARRLTVLALPVAFGAVMHMALAPIMTVGIHQRWWLVAIGFVAFCFLLALAGIAATVVPQRRDMVMVAAAVALTSFVMAVNWIVVIGAALEFASLLLIASHARSEAANRLKYSIARILSYGLSAGLVVFMAAFSAFSYIGLHANAVSGRLQNAFVEATVLTLNRSLPLVYKGYDPNMTVDEVIRQQIPSADEVLQDFRSGPIRPGERAEIERRLREAGLEPDVVNLDQIIAQSASQNERLHEEMSKALAGAEEAAVTELRDGIGNTLGIVIQGSERVEDVVRSVIQQRVDRLTQPHLRYIPPVLAVSVFLTLLLFLWAFTFVTWGLAWVLFSMMVHSGLVRPKEEMITVVRYTVV